MQIHQIIQTLETFAPTILQESYDNAGLIVGNQNLTCTGVLCCLDSTEEVILEAKAAGCNLVIAHHPIIFGGLKQLNGKNYIEKAVITAIKNDIAIYAIHTNLDNVLEGVSGVMADKLGLVHKKILLPKRLSTNSNKTDQSALTSDDQLVGSGIIAELPEPMEEIGFLKMLQTSFELQLIRHTPLLGKNIKKVALCGGSGSFLLKTAISAGADIYITADMKYHEFFDAEGRILVTDIGHWESEQFTTGLLIDILKAKFPTFAVLKSVIKTNPVNYFL